MWDFRHPPLQIWKKIILTQKNIKEIGDFLQKKQRKLQKKRENQSIEEANATLQLKVKDSRNHKAKKKGYSNILEFQA